MFSRLGKRPNIKRVDGVMVGFGRLNGRDEGVARIRVQAHCIWSLEGVILTAWNKKPTKKDL